MRSTLQSSWSRMHTFSSTKKLTLVILCRRAHMSPILPHRHSPQPHPIMISVLRANLLEGRTDERRGIRIITAEVVRLQRSPYSRTNRLKNLSRPHLTTANRLRNKLRPPKPPPQNQLPLSLSNGKCQSTVRTTMRRTPKKTLLSRTLSSWCNYLCWYLRNSTFSSTKDIVYVNIIFRLT